MGMLRLLRLRQMAIAILIIPLFDTLRAFTLGDPEKLPFLAHRSHIHHRLIDLGFSHITATYILIAVNLLFIVVV